MPRFFFDVNDGEDIFIDNAGIELPDMDAAIREARRALADMIRDAMRGVDGDRVSIRIRDGSEGPILLEVNFTTKDLGHQQG